jgi:hypothetical protein
MHDSDVCLTSAVSVALADGAGQSPAFSQDNSDVSDGASHHGDMVCVISQNINAV